MANGGDMLGRADLMERLQGLGIETTTVEHPEVFTVETMMPHLQHIEGVACKNLFLRDKKKKLFLFSARHDKEITLNDLAKLSGAKGGLRFADESVLEEKLGVKQGCVTAFALINDKNSDVTFLIDKALTDDTYERVFFHPMSNDASTGIAPKDLMKFIESTGHTPVVLNLDQ